MIKNYLLSAWRSLQRNRLNAGLNIVGLSAGIASCLFIFLFVTDEISYDKSFSMSERIYRIQSFYKFDDVDDKFGITPYPTGPTIQSEYPEVESFTRVTPNGQQFLRKGDAVFQVEEISFADSSFFDFFDFPFVSGDPQSALNNPKSLVLTKREAVRLFGTEDPHGKSLEWNNEAYQVTGVIDDESIRSHFEFDMLASMSSADTSITNYLIQDWGNNNSFTYILLPKSGMAEEFQPKLDNVVAKFQLPYWQTTGFNGKIEMHAEPLLDVHFNNNLIYDTSKKGNKNYVLIFSIVALLTLTIACINFINLSVAGASRRVKEVAMRKVVGATKQNLILQFVGEALLLAIFSTILAFAFVEILLPYFNEITGKSMKGNILFSSQMIGFTAVLILFVGLVAGSYPAFYISSLPVVAIFRDARTSLGRTGFLRKALVTFQFTLSIAMIIATLSVLSQLSYMRNKDLGFTQENMIAITLPQADTSQYAPLTAFRNELKTFPFVKNVARSAQIPGAQTARFVLKVNTSSGEQDKPFAVMFTDENYLAMSKMKVNEGRLFTELDASNPFGVVLVNKALINACGWSNPLSEKVTIPGDGVNPSQSAQVIGVLEDFHFASLHHKIEPLVIAQQNPRGVAGYLMLETQSLAGNDNLSQIEMSWKKYFQEKEFDYVFLTDRFARMYESEDKMFQISIYFAALALLLCCLGLYGLSSITTQQRTKEIGIRKVMGASVFRILQLLNRDFLTLVGVSVLMSFPIAWYGVTRWYENFAYHEELNFYFFLMAAIFACVITVVTVSLIAIKTALRDPVKALRYE